MFSTINIFAVHKDAMRSYKGQFNLANGDQFRTILLEIQRLSLQINLTDGHIVSAPATNFMSVAGIECLHLLNS